MNNLHDYSVPVNNNQDMYKLIDDVKRLVDENKFLIEELKSLRRFYPDYDESCSLFSNER
jgi:hypothetical protein